MQHHNQYPHRDAQHVTLATAPVLERLPPWLTLVRASNAGPMTLDGTNTWVLRTPGSRQCIVVDPGPLDEQHLDAVATHAPVAAILVTHGHPDHIDGLATLSDLVGGPPVMAGLRARTDGPGPDITDGPGPDITDGPGPDITDGPGPDITDELGLDITDGLGLDITVLPTPGHTSDSVSFLVEADGRQAVLTGDTILGRGMTVVAHPDGNLGDYLDSLRRLEQLHGVPVLPGHGPALTDCSTAARFYLEHRLARLTQVRHAMAAGARTAADVVAIVYADVDRSLWGAAELSVNAQLAYLREHDDMRVDGIRHDVGKLG